MLVFVNESTRERERAMRAHGLYLFVCHSFDYTELSVQLLLVFSSSDTSAHTFTVSMATEPTGAHVKLFKP